MADDQRARTDSARRAVSFELTGGAGANAAELVARAEQLDPLVAERSSTRETDRMVEGVYPSYMARGVGAYVWDVDGSRYVDLICGYGPVILGHRHPAVTDAVRRELDAGFCLTFPKPLHIDLLEKLRQVIPNFEMGLLVKSGSDATAIAVRLARIFTGRAKVVHWGYHGWHDWSCPRSAGVPGTTRADTLSFEYNDLSSLEFVFANYPEQIACVVMMPLELDLPKPGFLEAVRDLAHTHGALLVFDEVRSGFRLALGGAQQAFGVRADLAAFSKAMGNGHEIASLVGRADVLRGVRETHVVSTFMANSTGMAAALATIQTLATTDALDRIRQLGEVLQRELRAAIARRGIPAEVVGVPQMPWVRFHSEGLKESFYTATTRAGVLLHPSHHWFISAALTDGDLDHVLTASEHALAHLPAERLPERARPYAGQLAIA